MPRPATAEHDGDSILIPWLSTMRYDPRPRRYRPPTDYDSGFSRRFEGFERAREFAPPNRAFGEGFRWMADASRSSLSDLALHGPARYGLGPYHERLRRRKRPDEDLKRDVEEALFYDTWVDADAISVKVLDGIVTLEGELPNFEEVRFATDDAWDVDGVIGVRSDLRVDE